MLFILPFALLVYTNASLARKKGLNPFLWGGVSVLAFFVAYLLLGGIYVSFIYKGAMTPDAIKAWAYQSPLSVAMLILLGFGGMLLVRFIVERRQIP